MKKVKVPYNERFKKSSNLLGKKFKHITNSDNQEDKEYYLKQGYIIIDEAYDINNERLEQKYYAVYDNIETRKQINIKNEMKAKKEEEKRIREKKNLYKNRLGVLSTIELALEDLGACDSSIEYDTYIRKCFDNVIDGLNIIKKELGFEETIKNSDEYFN